jgi:hypothetical protein
MTGFFGSRITVFGLRLMKDPKIITPIEQHSQKNPLFLPFTKLVTV